MLVKDMRAGAKVKGTYLLKKVVEKRGETGPFLLFQLGDRSGVIGAVLWGGENAAGEIRAGDVVIVEGEVKKYQNYLQIKVGSIQPVRDKTIDPRLFIPTSSRNTDELLAEIHRLIDSIGDLALRKVVLEVYRDQGVARALPLAPAAKTWHHSHLGGLVEHIHDVASIAARVVDLYPEVDRDLLLAGALLHDIGKIKELGVEKGIDYTEEGRLLGHIVLGLEIVERALERVEGLEEEKEIRLKHMIVSHHGSLENGSPRRPKTIEAILLYHIDDLDAQTGGVQGVLAKSRAAWSDYIRMLDRFIYRGEHKEEG